MVVTAITCMLQHQSSSQTETWSRRGTRMRCWCVFNLLKYILFIGNRGLRALSIAGGAIYIQFGMRLLQFTDWSKPLLGQQESAGCSWCHSQLQLLIVSDVTLIVGIAFFTQWHCFIKTDLGLNPALKDNWLIDVQSYCQIVEPEFSLFLIVWGTKQTADVTVLIQIQNLGLTLFK